MTDFIKRSLDIDNNTIFSNIITLLCAALPFIIRFIKWLINRQNVGSWGPKIKVKTYEGFSRYIIILLTSLCTSILWAVVLGFLMGILSRETGGIVDLKNTSITVRANSVLLTGVLFLFFLKGLNRSAWVRRGLLDSQKHIFIYKKLLINIPYIACFIAVASIMCDNNYFKEVGSFMIFISEIIGLLWFGLFTKDIKKAPYSRADIYIKDSKAIRNVDIENIKIKQNIMIIKEQDRNWEAQIKKEAILRIDYYGERLYKIMEYPYVMQNLIYRLGKCRLIIRINRFIRRMADSW